MWFLQAAVALVAISLANCDQQCKNPTSQDATVQVNYVYKANSASDKAFVTTLEETFATVKCRLSRLAQVFIEGSTIECPSKDAHWLCVHMPASKSYHNLAFVETDEENAQKVTTHLLIPSENTDKEKLEANILNIFTTQWNEDFSIFVGDNEPYSQSENRDPKAVDKLDMKLLKMRNSSCLNCPMNLKKLTQFDATNLPLALEQAGKKQLVVVLFWLNIDAASNYALRLWANASEVISERTKSAIIGALACHDWPEVCHKYEVERWPQLIAMKDGQIYQTYNGLKDEQLFADWVHMLSRPMLSSLDEPKLTEIRKGNLAGFEGTTRYAVTVGFFGSKKDEEYKVYKKVARKLHGRYHLGAIVDEGIRGWAKNPVLMTFKVKERSEKTLTYANEFELYALIEFIEKSSRPTVLELSERSLMALHKRRKPYVLLIENKRWSTDARESFESLAIDADVRDSVTFVRFYADQNNFTKALLNRWKLLPSRLPTLALVYIPKCSVFVNQRADRLEKEEMKTWVQQTLIGGSEPHVFMPEMDYSLKKLPYDQLGRVYGTDSVTVSQLKEMDRSHSMSSQKIDSGEKNSKTASGKDEL